MGSVVAAPGRRVEDATDGFAGFVALEETHDVVGNRTCLMMV